MKAYMKKSKIMGKFNVEEYDSSMELVKILERRDIRPCWKGHTGDLKDGDEKWVGVKSYKEALNLLFNGWTDNLNVVQNKLNRVKTSGTGKRISFRNDVVGFAPVVPLAMMNVPKAMVNCYQKPIKSKVIKVFYNIAVSFSTSKDTILNNGIKVLEKIISLENSGYRCELYAMQAYCSMERSDVLIVKIKEANQPLDIKRIMFPLIHPAMFRSIGFQWESRSCDFLPCRGRPFTGVYKQNSSEIIKELFGDKSVFLDGTKMSEGGTEYLDSQFGEN